MNSEFFNFAAAVFEINQSRPQKLAYVDDNRTLTYGELELHARRMAQTLLDAGLRREERLFVWMHDSVDWPITFLGALYAGIVPVAINTLLPASEVAFMLTNSRAQAVVVSDALKPLLQSAMALCMANGEPHEISHIFTSSTSTPQAMVDQSCKPMGTPAQTRADDIGFWLYSSGSTGKPKGTVHTHANPWHTAKLYGQDVLGIREDDVCFSAAKLFFAYGLGNALTFPLSVGATTILMAERPTPAATFKRWTGGTPLLARLQLKPTVFFGAPTGYAGMLISEQLPKPSAIALRLCSSAGEALPAEIGVQFTKIYNIPLVDGVGSTEMLHIYLSNTPTDIRFGTTGQPVTGYDIELRTEDGRSVADGEIGDLYIRGPSAALMYWSRREKSQATFQGSWLKSGDKFTRGIDGYYTYCGRSDDMFKVSGQYVSPIEVESVLMSHSTVLEAAVVATLDIQGLTRSKAFIVLKDGLPNDETASKRLALELQSFVKSTLAPHKYPRSIEFTSELPKTATGKIQRFRLRA